MAKRNPSQLVQDDSSHQPIAKKRKPFNRLSAAQQEMVSKKMVKRAEQQEKYFNDEDAAEVKRAKRRVRRARNKESRGMETRQTADDDMFWESYRAVIDRCKPSKEDLMNAAANPEQQIAIKTLHDDYRRWLR